MTNKQIIGGRGSAKPYTTLNTVEVLLELEHVKAENILLREENAIHIRDWEDKKNENYELASKNEILKNENDRLKEARKNSRCAWKSLEGTLCPEAQEQLDQLKAENDNLKSLIWWIHVGAEGADKATTEYYENRNTPYEENYWKRIRALQPPTYESKYKLALAEIKEIAEDKGYIGFWDEQISQILQKISEVEDEQE